MSHIRCYGELLWNDVTVDSSSVGPWFGTCSALGVRMQAPCLVYPLFIAQTTWFGMPDVCSTKGEWFEHSLKGHEIRDGNNIWVGFRLVEAPMGHMLLLLSKCGSLSRGEIGRVRAVLGDVWRLEVLEQSRDLRQVLQLE